MDSHPEFKGFTAIVLAGGRSRRMGRDKALLPWGQGTLLGRVIQRLRPIAQETLVVASGTAAFGDLGARMVRDLIPGAHALGGLYTGLRLARYERCFVCACDMPFVNPALVSFLVDAAEGVDCVVPETGEGLQPLHAVYNRSALPVVEQRARSGQYDLRELVVSLSARIIQKNAVRKLDPDSESFLNLNTSADYARAVLRLRARHSV
jgi:molybdopterin-guanine dinucleotide biosynthesis protein A